MSTPQDHFDTCRRWQEYYDDKLRTIGMRAPSPVLGQTVADYCRKVLVQTKKAFIPRTHELRQFSLNDVRGDALAVLGPQILDAAVVEANNPQNVPKGELRKIERLDGYGKVSTIDWIGQESFVKQMSIPGRRMSIFNERTREWFPPRR
jgi:hypothetical protein